MSEKKRIQAGGGGTPWQSKCGVRHKLDTFKDVRDALTKYCREDGLTKTLQERRDEALARLKGGKGE